MLQIGSTPRIDTPSAVEVAFRAVIQDVALNTEHGGVLGIFLPIFPNETMSDGIPQVGCPPVVREPSTPAPSCRPQPCCTAEGQCPLRGSPRNTSPTVLPSQSKGLHRASFLGLVWYARMRYCGQGDSANTAASSWEHSRRGRAAHLTHTTKYPPPHMHNLPPAIPHSAPD